MGAATAVGTDPAWLPTVHLLVSMAIFTGLMVTLLWALEAATDGDGSPEPTSATETDDGPGPPEEVPSPRPEDRGPVTSATARDRAYLRMTKPRLMWLLCLVALAGMGLAAGPALDPWTAVATLIGGVLAIGASGVFNNVIERDVDEQMSRTADRPLVRDRVPVGRAIAFGAVLTVASVGVFLAFVNALSAVLGLLAILFYSVVYTVVLKPHTTHNIVLGGAVGAFPALIGWAAVENRVGVPALVLGAVIFLWTPAHFYNLALAYRDDYERAGFPMLPVVRGAATTRRHILSYLGATFVGAVALGGVAPLGWVYAGTIVFAGVVFVWAVVRLFHERTERAAFRSFHASNLYLGALLLAVLVETLVV